MERLIGVASLVTSDRRFNDEKLKQHSLIFDQIALSGLKAAKTAIEVQIKSSPNPQVLKLYAYILMLEKTGLIIESQEIHNFQIDEKNLDPSQANEIKRFREQFAQSKINQLNSEQLLQFALRLDAFGVRNKLKEDIVVPVIEDFHSGSGLATKHLAYQLIIDKIPIPTKDASWKKIVDFRNDPDSKRKFMALRVWITKMSKSNLKINEVEEELNHLLYEYEHHFKIHKMKYERGAFQTIVMGIAELVENIAHLNFSKVAEMPFKLLNKEVDLLEGEAKLPGQEIAYIFKAKQEFG